MTRQLRCATRISQVALGLSVGLCFLSNPKVSYAQAQGDDPLVKAGAQRFEEGLKFYDKGQFEQARAAFLQAYALKRHPVVMLNLALSCSKAGKSLEATRYFRELLREPNVPEKQRVEAERGLAEARTKLGHIEVVAPAGAEISVDSDKPILTPLTEGIDVEPGSHVVHSKTSNGTADQKVTVAAGNKQKVAFQDGAKSDAEPLAVAPSVAPVAEPTGAQAPVAEADAGKKKNLLSPPATMIPVYIGLGVGGIGLIATIGFAVGKGNAQSAADDVSNKIRDERIKDGAANASGTCTNPALSGTDASGKEAKYTSACGLLKSNLDKVDSNATAANISAVFMVLGFGTAAGWYLFAPKKADSTPANDAPKTAKSSVTLVPWMGWDVRGASVSGRF